MKLHDLFARKFEELKGEKTRESAAVVLGIPASTLRGYIRKNSFPDEIAIALADYLRISMPREELLALEYDRPRVTSRNAAPQLAGLQAAYQVADARCDKLEAVMVESNELLNQLCSEMGEGDLRILLSATVNPLEFAKYKEETRSKHVETAARAIATGIANGGTFVYIRPEAALLEEYDQNWHFEGRWPSVEETRAQISEFRDFVAAHLIETKEMSPEEAMDRAYRATPQYHAASTLPFWMPGLTIMMFRAEAFSGGEDDRFVIQLPDNEWARIYLHKSQYLQARFLRCIRRVLDQYLQQFTNVADGAQLDPRHGRDIEVASELKNRMYS